MTSLYEISYYVIEQHIKLTLPAWSCLFTVRITRLHSTPLLFMRDYSLVVWLSLHVANFPGSRRTQYSVVLSVIFIAYSVLYLLLYFSRNGLYIYFPFTIDIITYTSILNLANLCVVKLLRKGYHVIHQFYVRFSLLVMSRWGNCQTMSKDRRSQVVNNIIFPPFFFSLRPMTLVFFLFLFRSEVRPPCVLYIVFMLINRQFFISREIQSCDCIFGFRR